jgi:nucleoid-associated protein YgaU
MKLLRALLVGCSMLALSSTLSAQGGKVTCKDGSKSAGGRGACSSHGGVATAAVKSPKADAKADAKAAKPAAPAKAEKAAAKAEKKAEAKAPKAEKAAAAAPAKVDEHDAKGATAECKDHTYSHAKSRRGACSRHGGVAKFLTGN